MSGLAGQAIGLDEQLTAIGEDRAVDPESRGSMEPFIGFSTTGESYDPSPTDFDAADDTVTSSSDGSTRYSPVYVGNELSWSGGVPADGIIFDTARGDSFLTAFTLSPGNGAVVTDSTVTFDSDTPVNVTFLLNQGAALLEQCFDTYVIDVLFNLTGPFGGAGIPGIIFGIKNSVLGWYGIQSMGHGGLGGGTVLPVRFTASSQTDSGTAGATIGTGILCENTIELSGSEFKVLAVNDSITGLDSTTDLTYTAGSLELPREFSNVGAVFYGGHVEIIGIKYSVAFPNAKYALLGDSLTQGRLASTDANSYGQLFRADHPVDTLICGAPGALIDDWTQGNLQTVAELNPKYMVVGLGINNLSAPSAESAAVAKAKYDVLIAEIEAMGILPIVVAVSPCNVTTVPEFNALLQSSYPRYVDIYTSMVGTGTSLSPAYDSGDGLHWNDAGHAHVANLVLSAISTNGWN